MTSQPLEYRILAALLLGSATSSEIALRLSVTRVQAQARIQWLKKQRMVYENGWGSAGGKPGFKYELTPSGRQWIEDIWHDQAQRLTPADS